MQNDRFLTTIFIVFTVFQSERNLKELTFSGLKNRQISPQNLLQPKEKR
jgi:hypothetical protein